jgi:thioredoxin-related protein
MDTIVKLSVLVAMVMVLVCSGCRKKADSTTPVAEETTAIADANAASVSWVTDFEMAKKKAADEGKDLFINFTGSDWCGWCIRLDKEVFRQKLFASEAPTRFVFVKIDFPRQTSLPAALKKQNDQLAQEYQVQGFPTIILADATGKTYAQTGYQEGGPMAYLQHLAELRMQRPAK